jgi:uroporphyrinogen-III synthase
MRILVTRPLEDANRFAQNLRALGHDPVLSPALDIVALDGPPIDIEPYAAIVITSANAVRALAGRAPSRRASVICVGPASASEASAAGFDNVTMSDGEGVAGLAATIPKLVPAGASLLYPSAEDVAGDLESALARLGFRIDRQILYRAVFAPALTPAAQSALQIGELGAVTYFSVRSVAGTVAAAKACGMDQALRRIPAFCFSAAVAAAAAPAASRTVTAARATEPAMLDCIGSSSQTGL